MQREVSMLIKKPVKTLPQQAYDQLLGWIARAPTEHLMVKVEVSLCNSRYKELDIPSPKVTNKTTEKMSMADSGAQMEVGGLELVDALGVTN